MKNSLLSFQEAVKGFRTVRQCELRGLNETADFLREFLLFAKDKEIINDAFKAAAAEADEFGDIPSCCLPRALYLSSLLRRGDFFGVYPEICSDCHHIEEPEALPPLLLFCQLYLDLSKQQTKAAHLVAVGGRAQNTISGLKAGGLKIALLRVGEVLEGLAQQRRLDAFCWWLLASIRRAQQRASEAIAALLECIRICPSFAAAWEDLTEVLAAQVFSPGRAHSPLPWAGPDSAAAPAAAAAAALVGAAVRPVVSGASGEGASAPAADERQRKNDGASQNQQQQHEQHSMQTDTHPACNQDVASSDTLSSSSSSSGVDASEVLQQEERQRRGLAGAEGTRGKCVISAAAQAAAAAIAAEGEAADETTTTATTRTTTTKTAAVVTSPTADGCHSHSTTQPWNLLFPEELLKMNCNEFLAALGLSDSGVYGRLYFALFCVKTNNFVIAAKHLSDLLTAFPSSPFLLSHLSKCAYELGEGESAVKLFQHLHLLHPSRLDFVGDYARLLAQQNDREGMKRLVETCQSMAPTAFCTFQVYGQQARLNGALDEAVEVLHAATALNPTAGDGWTQLGSAYLETGDLLSAAKAFAAAAAAAPAAAAAHLGGGQTQALLHNWAAAEQLYAAAVKCRPDLASTWWHLGTAEKQRNKHSAALKSFERSWLLCHSTESAAECFACAMRLRLDGEKGSMTAAVWAERLLESFFKETLGSKCPKATPLLHELSRGQVSNAWILSAALSKAPEAVLKAATFLAFFYADTGDETAAKFYSELLQNFGGPKRMQRLLQ